MHDTKLIRLYKTLDDQWKKRFQAFVDSPYYNTNPNLCKLLEFIASFESPYHQEELTREKGFRYIFGRNKPLNISYMTKLSSKLTKLLEQFISLEISKHSSFIVDYHMMEYYAKHGIENEYLNTYRQINKRFNREDISQETYYHRFIVEQEYNRYLSTQRDKGVGDVHFDSTIEALDVFYFLNKLIYECQRLNRSQIIKGFERKSEHIVDLDQIGKSDFKEIPIISIWFDAYQLLKSSDKLIHYHHLKEELVNINLPLPIPQLRILFTYLENAAIKIFRKREELYAELLFLYEHQMNNDILLDRQVLVPIIIRNYVTVALRTQNIPMAESFISKVEEKEFHREFMEDLELSKASILFNKKAYPEVLDIINRLKINNMFLKIEERRLRIKTYFHLEMEDSNFDALNSFRVFLTEHKSRISEFHLQSNRNFITTLLRLLKREYSYPRKEEKPLEIPQPIEEKEWIKSII